MHKEKYFAADTIAAEAQAMALELPFNTRAAAFSPAASALLIIDMQRYFLWAGSHAHIPAAAAIIPNINTLIAVFNKAARPVYFTRHVNCNQDAGQMGVWWGELLGRGHPLGALETGLDQAGLPVIEKTQYDAFFKTDLEPRLRQQSVQQLVITGVATHLCCESTARSAFTRGFSVFMAIDATATWNRELHVASLRGLAHGCAVPFLSGVLAAPTRDGS